MGGKTRQSKHIVPIILGHCADATTYIEPFIGGGWIFAAVSEEAALTVNCIGSDAHPDLMLMWLALRDGWQPPDEVSREEYRELRHSEPSALRGFVGFGCSFGGKWFGGYAVNERGDDYCGAAKRSALKKTSQMRGATLNHSDYRDAAIVANTGTVIYCDPPYAGATGYGMKFDSEEFWGRVKGWASQGATVLVSEYRAPPWANEIWSRDATVTLRADSNSLPATEKLFLVEPF